MRMQIGDMAATAIMLVGIAALDAAIGHGGRPAPRPEPTRPALSSAGRLAVERCRGHVTIIHDVHWAAACMALAEEEKATGLATLEPADDSPECSLPTERAERLNAERAAAEDRCQAEAVAESRTQ